jgi:uncharacterized protein
MMKHLLPIEAHDILRQGQIGHLGCVSNDSPYIVPVSYVYHEGNIYIHSMVGKKIDALRQNPKTCIQVQEVKNGFTWRSAIAFGKYQEITDPEERLWFMRRILKQFPYLTPVEDMAIGDRKEIIIFRILVEEVTAVSEG